MAAEAVATRRRIIARPRLTRLLDESPARIKLLVAPAGYGKTTLAQQWLGAPERRAVWYRARPAAGDVAALATEISTAVEQVVPQTGQRLLARLRATSHPEDDVEVLAELFAEQIAQWPTNAWLAIDDYQFVADSLPSERFVELLVESTRLQVQELDRHALAMEPEEAKSVLGRDDDAVQNLLGRAQGWPAVIGLAANAGELSPPGQGLPPALYDYFAEELYQRLDSGLQVALCKLCIPPIVTPDLRQILLGERAEAQTEAAVHLGVLHEENGSYEIHPLLRSFLEPKLQLLGRNQLDRLAALVIDHLIDVGSWDEAFDVIERMQTPVRIERLVAASINDIIDTGRISTLGLWLDAAARNHVSAPILDFGEAELAFRQGRYGTAAALASNAARAAGTSEYETTLRARILLRAGQSSLLDSRESEALDHFRAARVIAPPGPLEREALLGEFFCLVDMAMPDAGDLLDELDRSSMGGHEDLIRLSTAQMLYAERSGGLFEALARARDVHPLLDRVSDPIIKTSFLNCLGQVLGVTGNYAESLRIADELAAAAMEYRLMFVLSHAAILRSLAAVGLRDMASALDAIAEAERTSEDPHMKTAATIFRARLSLLRGDPESSLAILQKPLERRPSDAMYAEYLATRALAAAATGALDIAAETSDRVIGEMNYARGGCTTALLVKAVAASRAETRSSMSGMHRALDFAFEGGRLDEFVVVYRAFPSVLGEALASPDHGAATAALVGQANDARLAKQLGFAVSAPLAGRLGTLTSREQEVLVLVARGFTNKEIAAELVISESTVKVHVRHLLEKLGASTRTEAASRLGGGALSGDGGD